MFWLPKYTAIFLSWQGWDEHFTIYKKTEKMLRDQNERMGQKFESFAVFSYAIFKYMTMWSHQIFMSLFKNLQKLLANKMKQQNEKIDEVFRDLRMNQWHDIDYALWL